jgi:hypothetical protein
VHSSTLALFDQEARSRFLVVAISTARIPSDRQSTLLFWRCYNQSVKLGADPDLTGKARIRPHIEGEIEHILFHRLRATDCVEPIGINIDMTGGAGASTAAFGRYAGNPVFQGSFHDCRSVFGWNRPFCSLGIDKGYVDHAAPLLMSIGGLFRRQAHKRNYSRVEVDLTKIRRSAIQPGVAKN